MEFKYFDNNEFDPNTVYVFKHVLGWEFDSKVAQKVDANGKPNGTWHTTNEKEQQFQASSILAKVKD